MLVAWLRSPVSAPQRAALEGALDPDVWRAPSGLVSRQLSLSKLGAVASTCWAAGLWAPWGRTFLWAPREPRPAAGGLGRRVDEAIGRSTDQPINRLAHQPISPPAHPQSRSSADPQVLKVLTEACGCACQGPSRGRPTC